MINNLKQKILNELEKKEIPDLKFLFSDEVLNISLALLRELLEEEKQDFEEKLKTPDEKITFDLFDDFSKLDYFWSLLNHFENVNSGDKIRQIIEDFEGEYVDFWNYIAYNKRYYDILVYTRQNIDLDEEQIRILYQSIKAYKIRWIDLEKQKQDELKEISKRLSELSQKFWNNVLDSQKEFEYNLPNDEFLKEFPFDDLDQAKKRAEEKVQIWFTFDASPSSYISIMKYCSNSEIRKVFYKAKSSFASNWDFDNRSIVLETLNLRDKQAKILGYKNHGELSLVFKMAETPEQIINLLEDITKNAKIKASKELEELRNHFNLSEINPWDTGYYFRKLKEEKYNLDDRELKKYFEFENTLKELFWVVNKLYSIEMKEISWDKYDENIRYYEVYKDSKLISYFVADYFYNQNKRSWAWADTLRAKHISVPLSQPFPPMEKRKKEFLPIVVNVCNFTKSSEWKTLLTMLDVETMFHEFGHAIHEMLAFSKYSELTWFNVEWDFVELPSQLLENWCSDNEALKVVSKHHETWEIIPENILESLENLKTFWTWNATLRQNEFALLDMFLHTSDIPKTIEELDKKTLEISNSLNIFENEEDYKSYTSFTHIFDWWYSAWYYSYMWAEIIEADIFAEFKKNWIFDKKTSTRFLNTILWQGSRKDASELFKDFMNREVKTDAFFERKGF